MSEFSVCIVSEGDEFIENQWDYLFINYQPKELFIIGPISSEWARHKPIKNATQIVNADQLPIDRPLVVMSGEQGRYVQGTVSLPEFIHPENAIYLFGANDRHLNFELGDRKPDHIVYIPVVESMYSFIAAGITFYDRGVKFG